MTIARHYVMHAKDGESAVLETALRNVIDLIRAVPGCAGIELLRDLGNEHRFIFIEKWESVEAHKAAPQHLPDGALGPVMAALDGPPDGGYLDYLQTA